MLLCQMTRRWLGALQLLWNPDCGGVITQANAPAFEVLHADPGADQAIGNVNLSVLNWQLPMDNF